MKTRKIKLQFADEANNAKMITVDYPRDDANATEIKEAMDQMVGAGILQSKEGPITTTSKAYEEMLERNEFDI